MATAETVRTSLVLNGQTVEVSAPPDTPLLYALRGPLDHKGARFGCGQALCGACTVIVDGRAVPSCDLPLHAVAGCRVETIEGLSRDGARHPLVTALIETQAGQCGYCLPGIVMKAKALLDEKPGASRAEIAAALEDNLCRCGTHVRILKAIDKVAAEAREDTR